MGPFFARLLGVVQGLTEFLPISSSGHLQLVQSFFHIEEDLSFSFICHLGTLGSILVLMWRDLLGLNRRTAGLIALGTLPLLIVPLVKGQIEATFGSMRLLGCCFWITACVLWIGERWGRISQSDRLSDGLVIGVSQLLALIPGVSRSGSTISSARLLGWERERAVRFSFLLVIPALLGGTVVQGFGELKEPLSIYLIGFASSFLIGSLSLWFLLRWIKKGRLMPFVWYCLILGVLAWTR